MGKKDSLKKENVEFLDAEQQTELEQMREEFLKEDEGFSWYFLNVLSTQEGSIKERIDKYITESGLEEDIVKVLMPEISVSVMNKGIKEERKKKLYPGYLLIKMRTINSADEADRNLGLWNRIRNINGVIDFVGTKSNHAPIPVSAGELVKAFKAKEGGASAAKFEFKIGDKIKIVDGPFTDFIGEVSEVDEDKLQLKVIIAVFGRQTPVMISFEEVEKI